MIGLYNNNNNNRKLIHPVILKQWKYGHSPSRIIVFFFYANEKQRSFLDRNTSNTNSLQKKKHQLALTHIKKDLSLLTNLFIDWHRGKEVLTFHFMSVMGNGHQCVLWWEEKLIQHPCITFTQNISIFILLYFDYFILRLYFQRLIPN